MRTPFILLFSWTAFILGCTEDIDSTENGIVEDETYSFSILSPEADAEYEEGELISLVVEVVNSSGASVTIDQVSWQTGDWIANGNNLTVTDLPEGSRALTVIAVAQGETFSDSVDIHIGSMPDQTDDDRINGDYSGVVEADITLKLAASSGGTTYEDPCEGWVEFNIDASFLTGEGSCRAFGEDWVFAIQGTDVDGILEGSLSMEFPEEDIQTEPTDFNGTRDKLGHVDIQFDGLHYPGEVSGVHIEYIDLSGSIIADPSLD